MSTRARIMVLVFASAIAAAAGFWEGHQLESDLVRCPIDVCRKMCRGEPEPVVPEDCPRPLCICTPDGGVPY